MRQTQSITPDNESQVARAVNAIGATLPADAEQALTRAATDRLIADLFGDLQGEGE